MDYSEISSRTKSDSFSFSFFRLVRFVALFTFLNVSAYSDVWYVDRENMSGTENGTQWLTAFVTIQAAIDAASSGDEVWVANGVYDELRSSVGADSSGVDTGSVVMKDGVDIFGGFAGSENNLSQRDRDLNRTIVDGSVARAGAPAYHVVVGADDALLDGFYIVGGVAQGGTHDTGDPRQEGGGVFCEDVETTISNCVFVENIAERGGAVFCQYSTLPSTIPTISDCVFIANKARNITGTGNGSGGAVHINSLFDTLTLVASVSGSLFINNQVEEAGGAIGLDGWAEVTIDQCVFVGNRSSGGWSSQYGGAVSISDFSFTSVANCLFVGNRAKEGGAIWNDHFTATSIFNSTFAANTASVAGGAIGDRDILSYTTVTNSVLWGNLPNDYSTTTSSIVNYSNTNQGGFGGVGNLQTDPFFVGGPGGTTIELSYDGAAFKSVITDAGGSFTSGSLKDNILVVDGSEYYVITANTGTTITVWGDVSVGGTVNAGVPYVVNDYHLTIASPVIDQGTATGAPTSDLDGTSRPLLDGFDMGAYEFFYDGCVYEAYFQLEWPLLAADLGLNENVAETPGKRVPERWGLAMIEAVLCNERHPHRDETLAAYQNNLSELFLETNYSSIEPYRHVVAALFLVNQQRQNHFKTLLGLSRNTYVIAKEPSTSRNPGDDIFGDDADLDGDGKSNADEYDDVVLAGGDVDDFVFEVGGAIAAMRLHLMTMLMLAFMGLLAFGAWRSFKNTRARA